MDPYGPAFPALVPLRYDGPAVTDPTRPGMDLRTYVAAAALQGILAASTIGELPGFGEAGRDALRYADALLAELAKVRAPPPH